MRRLLVTVAAGAGASLLLSAGEASAKLVPEGSPVPSIAAKQTSQPMTPPTSPAGSQAVQSPATPEGNAPPVERGAAPIEGSGASVDPTPVADASIGEVVPRGSKMSPGVDSSPVLRVDRSGRPGIAERSVLLGPADRAISILVAGLDEARVFLARAAEACHTAAAGATGGPTTVLWVLAGLAAFAPPLLWGRARFADDPLPQLLYAPLVIAPG